MAAIPFFLEPRAFTIVSASAGPAERPAAHLAEFKYAGMVWQSNAAAEHNVVIDFGAAFDCHTMPAYLNSARCAAERPAAHLAEFKYAGMVWQSNAAAEHNVVIDFGAAVAIDHVSLLNTNAQAGTRIRVTFGTSSAQASGGSPAFDTGWSTLISPAVTGRDFYHGFLSFAAQTFRYMMIRIDTHSGIFQAATLAAGQRLSPSRYYETDWEDGPDDLGTFALSRFGVPDDVPGVVARRLGFTLAWLSEAEYEGSFAPMLQRIGRRTPILLCFDPEATIYRQRRTFFGTMVDTSRARKVAYQRFEKRFEIQSVI